jgi:hypothetical protein
MGKAVRRLYSAWRLCFAGIRANATYLDESKLSRRGRSSDLRLVVAHRVDHQKHDLIVIVAALSLIYIRGFNSRQQHKVLGYTWTENAAVDGRQRKMLSFESW